MGGNKLLGALDTPFTTTMTPSFALHAPLSSRSHRVLSAVECEALQHSSGASRPRGTELHGSPHDRGRARTRYVWFRWLRVAVPARENAWQLAGRKFRHVFSSMQEWPDKCSKCELVDVSRMRDEILASKKGKKGENLLPRD